MVRFSVDCKASAVQVGVERPAAVDNSKEFSFYVCVPCLHIREGFAGEGKRFTVLSEGGT